MNKVGQFASYHIYPYYPDFINYDLNYENYVDANGEQNNYAGYLNELKAEHKLPILVAEFGIPSSRGMTHRGANNKNQGGHDEAEAGEIVSSMFDDIIHEGYMGGLIFTWQDEWFKRTWNTMEYDDPNRRPFWSNQQTSEQHFGLLGFETMKIKVDGDSSDWTKPPLYKSADSSHNALYVDHDETYLYIRIDYDPKKKVIPYVFLDTLPDQGNHKINQMLKEIRFENGLDFMIQIKPDDSQILVDRYYNYLLYLYGIELDFIDIGDKLPTKNSGDFDQISYALNRKYYIMDRDILLPFETYETGKLREGNGNPDSSNYNSLTDYAVNKEEGCIELRLPWLLIHSADPSHKTFLGDFIKNGFNLVHLDGISIGAIYTDDEGKVIEAFPSINDNTQGLYKLYNWDKWEHPKSTPRLKKSYYKIQERFSQEDD